MNSSEDSEADRQLIVVDELFGRVFSLPEGTTIIGRSDECDITVSRGSIGQRHAALRWKDGVLSVEDLKSTNGTYVLPRESADEGGGARLAVGRTTIEIGDRLLFGLGRLVVRPVEWLGDQPPGSLPAGSVDKTTAKAVMETTRTRGDLSKFDPETLDAVWVDAFLRWRRKPRRQRLFEDGERMCSGRLLVALRDGLDDPVRWFVDRGLDVVRMLAKAEAPIGVLLALDVRLRHASRGFREVGGIAVRKSASKRGLSITQLACHRFTELADGSLDDLHVRFAENAIESARKQGIAWSTRDWRQLMSHGAFASAARSFVFKIRGRPAMFRPVDDELLTLDGTTTVRPGEQIGVAPTLGAAWHEHLAEYEVVQPFPQ